MKRFYVNWSIDLLKALALIYKTRNAWQRGEANAYIAAMRRGGGT